MKIVMSCGGTGGHIYPAIAIADKIREHHPEAEILFIVTKKGKTKIYQTNKQFPILKELQSIVIKSQKGNKPSKTIG